MAQPGGGEGGVSMAKIPVRMSRDLRACRRCRLVKTFDAFKQSGCDNCCFFQMEDYPERVVNCLTPKFTGLVSAVDPTRSWATRWLSCGKVVPGCYALAVFEALPPDLLNICKESGAPYVPPRSVSS